MEEFRYKRVQIPIKKIIRALKILKKNDCLFFNKNKTIPVFDFSKEPFLADINKYKETKKRKLCAYIDSTPNTIKLIIGVKWANLIKIDIKEYNINPKFYEYDVEFFARYDDEKVSNLRGWHAYTLFCQEVGSENIQFLKDLKIPAPKEYSTAFRGSLADIEKTYNNLITIDINSSYTYEMKKIFKKLGNEDLYQRFCVMADKLYEQKKEGDISKNAKFKLNALTGFFKRVEGLEWLYNEIVKKASERLYRTINFLISEGFEVLKYNTDSITINETDKVINLRFSEKMGDWKIEHHKESRIISEINYQHDGKLTRSGHLRRDNVKSDIIQRIEYKDYTLYLDIDHNQKLILEEIPAYYSEGD